MRQLQLCFYPVESGKELLYSCNYAALLGERGKGKYNLLNNIPSDSLLSNDSIECAYTLFNKVIRFEEE